MCFGTDHMELSWLGIPECILCAPGDFCDGCDTFKRCPDSDRPGREGPRVSQAGSTRFNDCETCPPGKEAFFDRATCAPKYTSVCNKEFVSRCINNCRAEDPQMGKQLTPCELLKCTVYCAKTGSLAGRRSDECLGVVGLHCRYLTTGVDSVGSLAAEPDEVLVEGCDVDCDSALSRQAASTVLAGAALLFAVRALWADVS